MSIKIENGKVNLMLQVGSRISANSHFTIPYTGSKHRREVSECLIVYDGNGNFHTSPSSRGETVKERFTTYYYKTTNPDYEVVELPIDVKSKGYVTTPKYGGILVTMDNGDVGIARKLWISPEQFLIWSYDAVKFPMPEIIGTRHRAASDKHEQRKKTAEPEEKRPAGRVNKKQLTFADDAYTEKENKFAAYLTESRGMKEEEAKFCKSVVHFVLQRVPDDALIRFVDADSLFERELKGYTTIRKDRQVKYTRVLRFWGDFCNGIKPCDYSEVMKRYDKFVRYQQNRHYSIDSIMNTCRIMDKVKEQNGYGDAEILDMDSNKLCEKITGHRYRQSDNYLNNIIRKYQTYLKECEA